MNFGAIKSDLGLNHSICAHSQKLQLQAQSSSRHKLRRRENNAAKIFPVPPQDHACCKDSSDRLRGLGSELIHTRVPTQSLYKRVRWDIFPEDIKDAILVKLDYKHMCQVKPVSKSLKTRIESEGFRRYRGRVQPREGLLTALHFSVGKQGVWECGGYDLATGTWRTLPPFDILPQLHLALFKDHSICGARGLMCANVATASSMRENLIVFNPVTRMWRKLPSLNHPRTPVLVHMVAEDSGAYKIIVAGSARGGYSAQESDLSKVTEVFDSEIGSWKTTEDVPGPVFALNEHQAGATVNGILFCVAFLDVGVPGKGLIAYNIDEGKWVPHLTCRLPYAKNLSIVQLVELGRELFLFSEIERNLFNAGTVEQRIEILERDNLFLCSTAANSSSTGDHAIQGVWRNVMTETKAGSQGCASGVSGIHLCAVWGRQIVHIQHDCTQGRCLRCAEWKTSGIAPVTPCISRFKHSEGYYEILQHESHHLQF